jgi:hypothetical protein
MAPGWIVSLPDWREPAFTARGFQADAGLRREDALARLRALAFAAALTFAAPGEAETGGAVEANAPTSAIRFSAEDPLQIKSRGFSFPIVEYTDPRGVRQERKGIIASKMIATDTLIGIGFFETTPKSQGYWDVAPNVAPRRSRRAAAIGLNWRF